MEDSIFTKIIKGEIPCDKVYEDESVIAFLDIAPLTYGHTLVVPKTQIDHLWDSDSDLYIHIMEVARLVARKQREVLSPKRVGLIVEGFAVAHAHVHVFPLYEGIEPTFLSKVEAPTSNMLTDMAAKLAF